MKHETKYKKEISLISKSADETMKIGEEIGKRLRPQSFLSLVGDLGGGKTTFVKGVAKGVGIDKDQLVTSPHLR